LAYLSFGLFRILVSRFNLPAGHVTIIAIPGGN